MKIEKVKFEGIDDWNRPVFKSLENKNRYGLTGELFSHGVKEKYVLRCLGEVKSLTFFGTRFNCEPTGGDYPVEVIQLTTITTN